VSGVKGNALWLFPSKEELFSAVVRGVGEEHVLPMLHKLDLDDDTTSINTTLTDLSQTLINFLVLPQAIASYRLAVAEAGRFPHLGIAFYESGKRVGERHIARWMARQMLKGRLKQGDADIMAKQFIALCEVGPISKCCSGGQRRHRRRKRMRWPIWRSPHFLPPMGQDWTDRLPSRRGMAERAPVSVTYRHDGVATARI
jgi:AcrR family transcriptional regulator